MRVHYLSCRRNDGRCHWRVPAGDIFGLDGRFSGETVTWILPGIYSCPFLENWYFSKLAGFFLTKVFTVSSDKRGADWRCLPELENGCRGFENGREQDWRISGNCFLRGYRRYKFFCWQAYKIYCCFLANLEKNCPRSLLHSFWKLYSNNNGTML